MELLILACLIAEPQRCREFDQITEARSQTQCMNAAALALVPRWIAEHPGYEARSWRCRPIGPPEREA